MARRGLYNVGMQDEQRQEEERPIPESEWPYEGDERDDWPKPDAPPAAVDKKTDRNGDASPVRQLWRASMIGIHIVTSTFVGLAMGYWLDRLFGSEPWLTIIFLLIGIAAGFRDLFRFAWDSDKPFTPKKPVSKEGEGGNGKA